MNSVTFTCLLAVLAVALASHRNDRFRRQYGGGLDSGYRNQGSDAATPSRFANIKRCINIHELANGQALCAYSGCRLRCIPGYSFGESIAEKRVTLSCNHHTGELYFRNSKWQPQMTICSPECKQPCLNGGSCVGPEKCSCQAGYSGKFCEQELMLGDSPYGGYIQAQQLSDNQRRVVCKEGEAMPDGSTSVVLTYRDSHYFFPDGQVLLGVDQVTCSRVEHHQSPKVPVSNKPKTPYPAIQTEKPGRPLPLIQPTTQYVTPPSQKSPFECSPPCANGGECVYTDTCSCPRGFWGPRCYTKICSYPRFEANLHASLGGTLRRMKFECHPGYQTQQGKDRVIVLCMEGQWKLPSGKPLAEEDVKCY